MANKEKNIFDVNLNNPICNLFTYSFVNGNQYVVKYNFAPLEFYDGEIDVMIEDASTGDLITNFIHTNNGTSSRTIDFSLCSPSFPNLCSHFNKGTHIIIYITYKNCSKTIDIYF